MAMARFSRSIERTPGSLPTWLDLVHECNGVEAGFFGAPDDRGDWWAGGTFEEYPHARIIRDGDSVRVASRTAHGDEVLRRAAQRLGVHVAGE